MTLKQVSEDLQIGSGLYEFEQQKDLAENKRIRPANVKQQVSGIGGNLKSRVGFTIGFDLHKPVECLFQSRVGFGEQDRIAVVIPPYMNVLATELGQEAAGFTIGQLAADALEQFGK